VDEGDCLFRLGLVELCLEERAPMILLGLVSLTGSQKVGGSNPPSSTLKQRQLTLPQITFRLLTIPTRN
jgi:hypothetical protein